MPGVAGIDREVDGAPTEIAMWTARYWFARSRLTRTFVTALSARLHRRNMKIAKGTIVDAAIIGEFHEVQDGRPDSCRSTLLRRDGSGTSGRGSASVPTAERVRL